MIPNYAYFQGNIVPYSEAKVGVLTHSFNYGTGAFAGVRGYWNEDEKQLFLFRPRDHFTRLLQSGKLLFMEFDFSPEDLTKITIDLMKKENHQQDVYIRPLIYKSDEMIGVRLHDVNCDISIVSIPFKRYVANDTNAHVTISSWRRVDDNMIPPRGKIVGAYVNSALIKTDAVNAGFDEGLVLNVDGHLSEGSAENLFIIKNNKLVTPAVTDNILEGITRRAVMKLAADEVGIEIVERSIDRTEIYLADEAFMTGTAAEVTAITKVDHRVVGTGEMGPITAKIKELYNDVLRGKIAKYRDWNTPVY